MADIVTFDPIELVITEIDAGGDNELSLVEVYSEWKGWLLADPFRLGYPPAFRQVGGDPISPTQSLGTTFFLINGWRIRPAETNHKLTLVGNLFTEPSGDSVFVPTLGAFTVNTETRVSNLIDQVAGSGSGGLTLQQAAMLQELHRRQGLDPATPLIVSPTAISAGLGLNQIITEGPPGVVTVERV